LHSNREICDIEVWTWLTPNGHKVHIALEELGLSYKVIPVNIGTGEQFKPEFLAINPNHRIPAIVDPEGPGGKPLRLFESGAILIYLAEKTGGKLIPKDPATRCICLEWLMFQMGGVGPMFGQWNHFAAYAVEKLPYAIERYTTRSNGCTACSIIASVKPPTSLGTNTALPTSRLSRGCAIPIGAASIWPNIPRSSAGTMR
jgi:hypothetical protein